MNMPALSEIEPLLKAGDVARRLSISRTAAYRLMTTELPAVRIGTGTVRVKAADLEKYVEDHMTCGGQ